MDPAWSGGDGLPRTALRKVPPPQVSCFRHNMGEPIGSTALAAAT